MSPTPTNTSGQQPGNANPSSNQPSNAPATPSPVSHANAVTITSSSQSSTSTTSGGNGGPVPVSGGQQLPAANPVSAIAPSGQAPNQTPQVVVPAQPTLQDEQDKGGYWSGPEGNPLKMSLQNPTSKFDGKNFSAYREMLYPYLRAYSCVSIIEGTEPIPPKSNDPAQIAKRNEWKKRHNLVEILLINTLRDQDRVLLADK
jgi:hypothetical protein